MKFIEWATEKHAELKRIAIEDPGRLDEAIRKYLDEAFQLGKRNCAHHLAKRWGEGHDMSDIYGSNE